MILILILNFLVTVRGCQLHHTGKRLVHGYCIINPACTTYHGARCMCGADMIFQVLICQTCTVCKGFKHLHPVRRMPPHLCSTDFSSESIHWSRTALLDLETSCFVPCIYADCLQWSIEHAPKRPVKSQLLLYAAGICDDRHNSETVLTMMIPITKANCHLIS